MTSLSNEDMSLCVAYVDGALDEDARLAFELRMAAEPDLAQATQALLETDELMRKLSVEEQRAQPRIARVRWTKYLPLAAAAAVVILFLTYNRRDDGARTLVAVAPGFESPRDYIASRPELAGLRPAGVDVLRGDNAAPNIGADEFLAKASAVEDATTALAVHEATAGYFVLPIYLARDSRVVVYAFASGAKKGEPVAPLFAADLRADRHVLPGPRFATGERPGEVRYERGFLVPVGAVELDVLVAIGKPSAEPMPGQRFTDAAQAERELRSQGFDVRHLRVREPKN